MNNTIRVEKILDEFYIKNTDIPTDSFEKLCEFVARKMTRRYGIKRSSINCGYCFIWAYLVYCLWPNKDEITFLTNDNHVIIRRFEKYYDSDNVNGVMSAECITSMWYSMETDVKNMCKYWARAGKSWRKFRRLILSVGSMKFYREVRDNGSNGWRDGALHFRGGLEIIGG